MFPTRSRLLSCLAALLTLLAMCDAGAVVLGEIRSSSRLGELLHAEIDIEEEPADRFDASCVKLYRPAQASGDLPWITEARLSFRRESGKGKLYISADHPLREPVVQIGVQSTCPGGRVWRDYTFLVSPAASARREAAPAPVALQLVKAPVPAQKIDRVSLSAPVAGEPARRPTAETARPAHKVPAPRADGQPALRMAAELHVSASPSEAERDLLRREYRLLAALHEDAGSQLAQVEALRRQRPAASAVIAPSPVSMPALPPEPSPAPLNEKTEVALAPPVALEPATPHSIPKARDEAHTPENTAELFDEPLYAGLGALAVVASFILWFVMRRRRAKALAAHSLPMHAPTLIVDEPEFSQAPEKAAEIPLEAVGQVPAAAPVVPMPPMAPIDPVALNIAPPEKLAVDPVMELAEIMLSFGRVQGAAQTLQEYIQANPKEALQPWIRLLEIYRENGLRAEFEKLATNLNQNFNVEIVHWDAAQPGERVEKTLELLPHIREQIDALWGRPECLDYLQKLLHDNRDGQRTGFALPVVKEILSLIDLMVAEKAAAK